MRKRKKIGVLILLTSVLLFTGACQDKSTSSYQDGSYIGKSVKDDDGAYAKVTLTFEDQKISDVQFVTYQKDGSIKDEEYGKSNGEIVNQEYYQKAQHAVEAMKTYQTKLKEKGTIAEVDVVSGATISFDQFKEAVENAMEKAEK